MRIRLKNIGLIKDSTITLDGLTVVTGKNNSGKTTVGKTLYALLDAVSYLQQKAESDKRFYIRKQLEAVSDTLELFRFIYMCTNELDQKIDLWGDYPTIKTFFDRDYRREFFEDDIEKYAHDLATELAAFDISIFEDMDNKEHLSYTKMTFMKSGSESRSIISRFDTQRNSALAILDQLFANLDKDVGLVDYARESINQTLRLEFANQVRPVKESVPYSKIELYDDDSAYFNIKIMDDNVVNDGMPVFFSSPYRKVYLVDDPFMLDDLSTDRIYRGFGKSKTETILNTSRIYSHNFKLKDKLRGGIKLSVFEQTVLNDSLKLVKAQIDRIIPGTFESSPSGEYYVQNGVKLKISNLATGSKMFSIVKMLLERGELDFDTMLILDEPEAHLHPKWQNAFAEIIVMLVKELRVNILLTTHSPNFMLALDAYMRKYKIADITNFYQTDLLEDNFVHYNCVNDDMGKIYQDFVQYMSEVKMLRNSYLNNIGE